MAGLVLAYRLPPQGEAFVSICLSIWKGLRDVIPRKCFANKLRELKYDFKEQLHYQERYRLRGGTHIIHVPRKDLLDEEYVRSVLTQAGQTKEQIAQFIRAANA